MPTTINHKSVSADYPFGTTAYQAHQYTCYDGSFLCPVLNGEPTLRCGLDCYLPEMYSCSNGELVYPPTSTPSSSPPASSSASAGAVCTETATTLHLSSPPYENYFYSDCNSANQVVVTSPLPDSNLTIIGPRLLVRHSILAIETWHWLVDSRFLPHTARSILVSPCDFAKYSRPIEIAAATIFSPSSPAPCYCPAVQRTLF